MIIRKAFKYRLKPTRQVESKFNQFAGCCRYVQNKGLALQKQLLDQKKSCLSYTKMAALLRDWKIEPETVFLKDCHCQPLQQTLMALDKAIKDAFDKKNPKRFPRFKKKGHHGSFRTTISQNHAIVVLEDWTIANMSKSAKGDMKNPGRNVRAKSGLNKSIPDQGWYAFRRQLEYKQLWPGGQVIAVNPGNTSRSCPLCNHTEKDNRKSQAVFVCIKCGFKENADDTAAINIPAAGQAVSACGDIRPVTA